MSSSKRAAKATKKSQPSTHQRASISLSQALQGQNLPAQSPLKRALPASSRSVLPQIPEVPTRVLVSSTAPNSTTTARHVSPLQIILQRPDGVNYVPMVQPLVEAFKMNQLELAHLSALLKTLSWTNIRNIFDVKAMLFTAIIVSKVSFFDVLLQRLTLTSIHIGDL